MMVDSLERMPPEKIKRFSGEIALVETARGGHAETAGGDSLLPMAGGPLSALVPVGTEISQIQGSSTTVELRQQVTRTVTPGNPNSPGKLGLRQHVANLKGALNQAGHRAHEEVAYTKYALNNEFENTVRQYEVEARVVRDQKVAQAARETPQRSGQRFSYLEQNIAQLKGQLGRATRGENAYQSELVSGESTKFW